VLKIVVSVALVGYLVGDAWLSHRRALEAGAVDGLPHNTIWALLPVAWVFCLTAVMITHVRWYFLVRALEVPLTFRDALRLGFLGYLFNLAPMGIVGGDILKAVMLGREYPAAKAKGLAAVLVDRLIGLQMLFVVAAGAMLITEFWRLPGAEIRTICWITFALAAGGTLGMGLLLLPTFGERSAIVALSRIPRVGGALASLAEAFSRYRRQPLTMLAACVMSVGVHCSFALGVYLLARALVGPLHTLGTHFVILPLSAAGGVIPLPAGPMEGALSVLYRLVPNAAGVVIHGEGTWVGLGYRISTLLIAVVGVGYYFSARREVAEVLETEETDTVRCEPGTPVLAVATPRVTASV